MSSECEQQVPSQTPTTEQSVERPAQEQPKPCAGEEQATDDCPEIAGPLEKFDVHTAGAEEEARVRKDALPKLVEKAGKLEPPPPPAAGAAPPAAGAAPPAAGAAPPANGATPPANGATPPATAQAKYEQELKAQTAALETLRLTILRIIAALECAVPEDVRTKLLDCFCKEVGNPAATADETEVPDLCCDPCADESVETLQTRITAIERAITWTANEFDSLVQLPDNLGTDVAALSKRATDLEGALCGPAAMDANRAFVELLRLKRDTWLLGKRLTSAYEYGCRLRVLLVQLIKLYTALACLSGKLKSGERAEDVREEKEAKKEAALVDLVLQCAKPPPVGEPPPDLGDFEPCKECSGKTSETAQTSAPPVESTA